MAEPDRERYLTGWSQLHDGIQPHGLARRWLLAVYPFARALRRVPPMVLTVAALVVSLAVPAICLPGGFWPILAAAAVLLGGGLDSLDGAVAAVAGRATGFGAVVDSVADRVSDSAYALALWVAGAPGWLVGVAAFTTALQEYVRARAAGLGLPPLPITVWERPTRVLLAAGVLLGCGLFSAHAGPLATAGAAAGLALSAVAFGQLRRSDEPGDDLGGERDER